MSRPHEGRVKATWYLLPLAKKIVEHLVCANANTPGKVIEALVGVKARANVAGAGRKAPRGQHGRATQKLSRAKAQNAKLTDERP